MRRNGTWNDALRKQGLYDPCFEHDACGVGFVANINGDAVARRSSSRASRCCRTSTHRGACGCDPLTGDGAGILMQVPDAFLRKACAAIDIELPPAGEYGVGLVFLPRDVHERNHCERAFEQDRPRGGPAAARLAHVPVDEQPVRPPGARATCRRSARSSSAAGRRRADQAGARAQALRDPQAHRAAGPRVQPATTASTSTLPSLSSRTIVYKGLLLPEQIPAFYLDLVDPDMASALALVHQRFSTNTFPSWDRAHPVPLPRPQRRDQHAARQHQLDARARRAMFASPLFGDDIKKILPIIEPNGSRLGDVRQRARAAGAHRPLAAARGDDDDPRGVAEARDR